MHVIKQVQILGVRGLPPAHGGFETFVGRLAPHLVSQGWQVTVFCQTSDLKPTGPPTWQGVDLSYVRASEGSRGSIAFDYAATRTASTMPGVCLVFGYNTAVFNTLLTSRKKAFAVNMDGIEWQRRKWGRSAKGWLYANEWFAAHTAPALIADHPAIARHLAKRAPRASIRMIPYGADEVDHAATVSRDKLYGAIPQRYATIIARPEPENSVLEMVQAFSARHRDAHLIVLGNYSKADSYQRRVLAAASDEVIFPGPVYDKRVVQELRANSAFYLYGHTVGGTSPTLVESLAAGATPLCLDTVYARWVAGGAGMYFRSVDECDRSITELLDQSADDREHRRRACLERFRADFTWPQVLGAYEALLKEIAQ
jgi:glycosyltransferase involved in cell wall biosynthesis